MNVRLLVQMVVILVIVLSLVFFVRIFSPDAVLVQFIILFFGVLYLGAYLYRRFRLR